MADTEAPAADAPADAPAPAAAVPEKKGGPATWKFPPRKESVKEELDPDTKLSRDQLKILKDAFNVFDSDKKGAISLDIIGDILELLGHDVEEEELDEILDEFDEDESGEIEFNEFIKLASRFVEPEEDYDQLRKELREVFMLYDKETRGYLPLDEFKKILRELDGEVPEDELDEIIDEIDTDGSGTIDFEEFMEVMTGE